MLVMVLGFEVVLVRLDIEFYIFSPEPISENLNYENFQFTNCFSIIIQTLSSS